MDMRVWHELGLELCDVDIESTSESRRGNTDEIVCRHKTLHARKRWRSTTKLIPANVVESLDVHHANPICVLQQKVTYDNVLYSTTAPIELWGHSHAAEMSLGVLPQTIDELGRQNQSQCPVQ